MNYETAKYQNLTLLQNFIDLIMPEKISAYRALYNFKNHEVDWDQIESDIYITYLDCIREYYTNPKNTDIKTYIIESLKKCIQYYFTHKVIAEQQARRIFQEQEFLKPKEKRVIYGKGKNKLELNWDGIREIERDILLLYYYRSMTLKEIAEVTGITYYSSQKIKQRAEIKFKNNNKHLLP